MSLLLPGGAVRRTGYASNLLFHWRAADGTLEARTGQPVRLGVSDYGIGRVTVGRNGSTIVGGVAMPRFVQVGTTRRPAVRIQPLVAGESVEEWVYDYALRVISMSVLLRTYPTFAVANNYAGPGVAFSLGNSNTAGGRFYVSRNGATWTATRSRTEVGMSSAVTEAAGATFPVDLLATLSTGGAVQLHARWANGTLASGPVQTNSLLVADAAWSAPSLWLGIGTAFGAPLSTDHEEVKVARGVRTFAEMDAL